MINVNMSHKSNFCCVQVNFCEVRWSFRADSSLHMMLWRALVKNSKWLLENFYTFIFLCLRFLLRRLATLGKGREHSCSSPLPAYQRWDIYLYYALRCLTRCRICNWKDVQLAITIVIWDIQLVFLIASHVLTVTNGNTSTNNNYISENKLTANINIKLDKICHPSGY